jgi:hypothetical protein
MVTLKELNEGLYCFGRFGSLSRANVNISTSILLTELINAGYIQRRYNSWEMTEKGRTQYLRIRQEENV